MRIETGAVGMPNSAAKNAGVTGDPSRIRTCNPRSRNPLLYPVELWDRSFASLGLALAFIALPI